MSMTSESTTQSTTKTGFLGRNAVVLILAAALVAVGIGTGLQLINNSRDLSGQQQQISDLEQRLAQAESANAEAEDANTYEALGVTESRLINDQAVIEEFLATAFTWQDGVSYEAARDALISRYDLDEDGAFLTDFMPPAAYTMRDGQRQYYIDEVGLVFSPGAEMSVDVVRVSGTDYEYIVLADVDVTSSHITPGSDGSTPTSTRRMMLCVTVDGEGELSGLSGIPPSGTTHISG